MEKTEKIVVAVQLPMRTKRRLETLARQKGQMFGSRPNVSAALRQVIGVGLKQVESKGGQGDASSD